MPILLLGLFLYAFMMIAGVLVVDSDHMTAKQMEIQRLLDNANHHASFALVEELKRQGIIEIDMPTALTRFHERMNQNGSYVWNGTSYAPSTQSITKKPVYANFHYVDFEEWQHSYELIMRYDGARMNEEAFRLTSDTGSRLNVTVIGSDGTTYQLVPKIMTGPCLIVVAMVDEDPMISRVGKQIIPFISVQEIKK